MILAFLLLPLFSLAENVQSGSILLLSDTENQQWLTELKAKSKQEQWSMIVNRYFAGDVTVTTEMGKKYAPAFVIDGRAITITDSTSADIKHKLRILLTNDKVADIRVLDKEPEGLYVNKAWTGLIVVTTTDKKTAKALNKIKFD